MKKPCLAKPAEVLGVLSVLMRSDLTASSYLSRNVNRIGLPKNVDPGSAQRVVPKCGRWKGERKEKGADG